MRIADDQTIEKVQMPKRLPRWITRPDESTAAERMILAQIADTDDLMTSLNRQIIALASSPALSADETRTLAKLASWQAAMAGPSLMRLVGSRIPALRLAALQRLAELSENDPRYELTWNAIERSINNAQRIAQVRQWFRLAAKWNATQRGTTRRIDQRTVDAGPGWSRLERLRLAPIRCQSATF